jgi:hypothetical protein
MFHKQPVRSVFTLALACGLWFGLVAPRSAAAEALPDSFGLIPDGTQIAIVVPDLARLKQHLTLVNDALELGESGLADVVEEFRRATGMRKGLSDSGAIVACMSMPSMAAPSGGQPSALLLVPVTKYEEFVSSLEGDSSADVTSLSMAWGQSVYCKKVRLRLATPVDGQKWQDYAVLGAQSRLVSRYAPRESNSAYADEAGQFASEYLATSDMTIVLNIAAMRPTLLAQIDLLAMLGQMVTSDALTTEGAAAIKSAAVAQTVFVDLVKQVLTDTDLAAITLDINSDGVGITGLMKFRAGSDLAAMFRPASGAPANDALVSFPATDYVSAQTFDLSSLDVTKIIEAVKAGLVAHQLQWIAQVIDTELPLDLLSRVKRASVVHYSQASSALGDASTLKPAGALLIETDDAAGFVRALRKHIDGLNGMSIDLPALPGPSGKTDPNAAPVNVRMTGIYTRAAQIAGNVEVDQYEVSYDIPFAVLTGVGARAGMLLDDMKQHKGFVAVVGDLVIITLTDNDQVLAEMLASVNKTRGLGKDQGLSKVRSHLPADATYRGYFDVSAFWKQVRSGLIADFELDETESSSLENLPPIGWAVAVNREGGAKRLFLPMQVLKAAKDPVIMLYELMTTMQQGPPEMVGQGGSMQPGSRQQPGRSRSGRGGRPGGAGGFPGGAGGVGGRPNF